MVYLKINPDQQTFYGLIKKIMLYRLPMKNPVIQAFSLSDLIWKKCGVQLSQRIASEFF